jgi:hypothetical protein
MRSREILARAAFLRGSDVSLSKIDAFVQAIQEMLAEEHAQMDAKLAAVEHKLTIEYADMVRELQGELQAAFARNKTLTAELNLCKLQLAAEIGRRIRDPGAQLQ